MSKPFLRSVAEHVFGQYKDTLETLCIVLPGKRASTFLKRHLAEVAGRTIWVPEIITAEDLVAELSGLQTAEEIDLICLLYESYVACIGPEAESFESFARWGNLILQDFNEIDRYLADPVQLYENLRDIKVIENWSLGEEKLSDHQTNYLHFMGSIGKIYQHYTRLLKSKKIAYQGLIYREAVHNLPDHTYLKERSTFLLCGFNALNEAELKICSHIQKLKKIDFLWDADTYYFNDKDQEAGHFLRKNINFFSLKEPQLLHSELTQEKSISIVSVPRQTGQAQVVRQTLERLLTEGVPMDKVALVLANEKLLWPVLQQLPSGVDSVNITMEYPLRYTSTYSLVEQLMNLQIAFNRQQRRHKQIYHQDLVTLLRHPLLNSLFKALTLKTKSSDLIAEVKRRNLSFITALQMRELLEDDYDICSFLFEETNVEGFVANIRSVLSILHQQLSLRPSNQSQLELEYLHILKKNFNRLGDIIQKYGQFREFQNFRQLYQQSLGNATAPFIGEPLKGLQIMGVLETRTLDFDHIILVNVNEGILPAGKTISSFIPNDLKRAFGLPLYLEKDAIYAYHFYRLLQRAKEVVITCDSETDSFGKGEKSRFITQLELELKQHSAIQITETVANYASLPQSESPVINIEKSETVMEPLLKKARSFEKYHSLSPSALISFKECPLRFYFQYSAGLKEAQQVEESADAGRFGSLLHLALENLYKPFLGKIIGAQDLQKTCDEIPNQVEFAFSESFGSQIHTGKLVLQQEVIKVYIEKLIQQDLRLIKELEKQAFPLQLLGLEQEHYAPLTVEIDGQTEVFYIKGNADRIDRHQNTVRIIDYKSSVKATDRFEFAGIAELFEDVKYNKQLQLFIYAWLLYKNNVAPPESLLPCIIPFKNFTEKPLSIVRNKVALEFTTALFEEFEEGLRTFIQKIFSAKTTFNQTDDGGLHEYCIYNSICQLN